MDKKTEKSLAALNDFCDNKTLFPLSLAMANKKLGKEDKINPAKIAIDWAVEELNLFKRTPSTIDTISTKVYVGDYDDGVRI